MSRIPCCPMTDEGCDDGRCRLDRCMLSIKAEAAAQLKQVETRIVSELDTGSFVGLGHSSKNASWYVKLLPRGTWIEADISSGDFNKLADALDAATPRGLGHDDFWRRQELGKPLPELSQVKAFIEGFEKNNRITDAQLTVKITAR